MALLVLVHWCLTCTACSLLCKCRCRTETALLVLGPEALFWGVATPFVMGLSVLRTCAMGPSERGLRHRDAVLRAAENVEGL